MDAEKFNFVQAKHFYLDAPKQPTGTCFVLHDDFTRVTDRLEDEWKSNNALMKLLADEKYRSEALTAELVAIRSERLNWAMGCECYCMACTRLDRFIRLGSAAAAKETSAQCEVGK